MVSWMLAVAACGGEPAPPADEPPAPASQGAEPEPSTPAPTDPGPADSTDAPPARSARCHVSCCSERVLELQAQSDDPSIQNECCFCDD